MEHQKFAELRKELETGRKVDLTFSCGGKTTVRRFLPKERLILLGGGHIALPLEQLGVLLNYSVTVVDDRPSFANAIRFEKADQVICDSFSHAIETLQIGEEDYVCTITRGHQHDAECLRALLKGEMPGYLGMIGSKRRVAGLMELLAEEGFPEEHLQQIHAPIGLDIHAQTPEEIAVAIAAQLIEVRRGGNKSAEKVEAERENYLTQTNVDWKLLELLAEPKEEMILALVMATGGSTPVKSGAMMAVGKLGRLEGTVGGGCGEAEIIREARKMMDTGGKRILTVSMTNEIAGEEGMVCGGRMEVLLEKID